LLLQIVILIGDEVVTEGLTTDLQAFYDKATSSEDKAKALQLLSAIRSGEERPQEPCPRPHTAMPAFGKCKGQKDRVFTKPSVTTSSPI
jgi:hypothetical protein